MNAELLMSLLLLAWLAGSAISMGLLMGAWIQLVSQGSSGFSLPGEPPR